MSILFSVLLFLLIFSVLTFNSIVRRKSTYESIYSKSNEIETQYAELTSKLKSFLKEHQIITPGEINNLEKATLSKSELQEAILTILEQTGQLPEMAEDDAFVVIQHAWNEGLEQYNAFNRSKDSARTAYNDTISRFPGNIIAGMTGYQQLSNE